MVFPKKMKKTIVKPLSERNFEFIGNHQNNSILVGNYGDAKIKAIGNFNLSGLIYCRQSTVEINMAGEGTARFNGICKKLIIQCVEGNCVLDLTEMSCQAVRCEIVKGKSIILLGEINGRPASRLLSNGDATALVRDGRKARHIGPLFASGPDQALALVNEIVRSENGPLLIDAVYEQQQFLEGLTGSGWTVERPFQRMRFGRATPHASALPFAVTGPEYG